MSFYSSHFNLIHHNYSIPYNKLQETNITIFIALFDTRYNVSINKIFPISMLYIILILPTIQTKLFVTIKNLHQNKIFFKN